jgi:Na+-driven multidrug efflux pump
VPAAILITGYSVFVFLAYGTPAPVARLIGAGDEREAAHQAVQSLWLALGISTLVAPPGLGRLMFVRLVTLAARVRGDRWLVVGAVR